MKEVDARLKAVETGESGLNFADGSQTVSLTSTPASMRSIGLVAPQAGYAIVTATANTRFSSTGFDSTICSITDDGTPVPTHQVLLSDSGVNASFQHLSLSTTRVFAVAAGTTTFDLLCQSGLGSSILYNSSLVAQFVPNLYAP